MTPYKINNRGLKPSWITAFLCVYSNIEAKQHFWLPGRPNWLVFHCLVSRLQCSVAVKTRGGQPQLPSTGGSHFDLRGERRGSRVAHVSYLQNVSAPTPPPSGPVLHPSLSPPPPQPQTALPSPQDPVRFGQGLHFV